MCDYNNIENCPTCKKVSKHRKAVSYINKVTQETIKGYETFCSEECKKRYLINSKDAINPNWLELGSKEHTDWLLTLIN